MFLGELDKKQCHICLNDSDHISVQNCWSYIKDYSDLSGKLILIYHWPAANNEFSSGVELTNSLKNKLPLDL